VAPPASGPTAPDGSVHPDRRLPTFERDVRRMFTSIADRYDAFNHLATFGQDFVWRPRAIWELMRFRHAPIRDILDVGCGTGTLARLLAVRFAEARVVAVDFSGQMVHRAEGRSRGRRSIGFAVANVGRLPFPDATFDVATSAFVARNLADLRAAFAELRRVLRPGGTLLTLEVSEPASASVGRLFHAHFDRAVPILGRAFDREGPYRYLPESLKSFPPTERFLATLSAVGFPRTRVCPMSLGIVTAYLSEASGADDLRS
jgi:demethylmenaquinone methyltransferase / 2-methoxy-6-polyprenyl-1,4-benzoquinol methylase